VDQFLEAARWNFAAARSRLGLTEAGFGCLLFSESAWHDYFHAFVEGLIDRTTGPWTVEPTDEPCSIVACRDRRPTMILIAGRQIVTAERLEVLALASSWSVPDGRPIDAVVEGAVSSGAITVLPWGFGKWFGKRGRVVARILDSPWGDQICLGDNAGRPAFAPRPRLFDLARSRGVPVLPGSDPLPFASQARKPGRYGFVLDAPVDTRSPALMIRKQLLRRFQPRQYGRLESLPSFIRSQIAMQVRGRLGERRTS
jgi:hypothetical protein